MKNTNPGQVELSPSFSRFPRLLDKFYRGLELLQCARRLQNGFLVHSKALTMIFFLESRMLRAKVRLSRIARENKFMNAKTSARLITLGAVPLLLLSTGCIATRKFVRNQTEPLESHITKVDQKVDQKTAQLDQDIRSLDEKTEAGISAAQNSADKANQ